MLTKIKDAYHKHKNKIYAAVSLTAAAYFFWRVFQEEGETPLSSFLQAVDRKKVSEIVFDNGTVFFRSQESQWYKTFLGSYSIQWVFQSIMDSDITYSVKRQNILPELLGIAGACLGTMVTTKIILREFDQKTVAPLPMKGADGAKTLLEDYYGGQEIKEKFRETIDLLRHPEKYEEMGARIRRGILFYGPPGTGKTMLARALANQAGCHFIRVVASEFQELYVGVGAKRVRQLFAAARRCPEGCIIFVDEIDALGSRMNQLRANHETTTTINQFLNEMDGFTPTQKVLIVAATNRIDLVDSAILRSGRFDVKVHIPLPNVQQRQGILQKLIAKKVGSNHQIDPQMLNAISIQTKNWCGADLQALLNEAVYRVISSKSQTLKDEHIWESFNQLRGLR